VNDLNNWQEKLEICIYAQKLLDKITDLNSRKKDLQKIVDITEVKKTIYYAKKYHGSQMRQSGEPFYSHPIEVAYMLVEYIGKYILRYARTDILVIALLHDTIEDTELTEEVISCIFGSKVASQVQALTRIKPEGKISSAEMVRRLYEEKNYDTLMVKLFDRLHNIQTISAKSSGKIKKIVRETQEVFLMLALYMELPNVGYFMNKLCTEAVSTKSPSEYYKWNFSYRTDYCLPIFGSNLIPKETHSQQAP